MTRESYNKATKLLKQIDEMESHILATKCQQSDLLPYPFMPVAYPYITKCLLDVTISEFYNKYKESLILEFEKLKQELENL